MMKLLTQVHREERTPHGTLQGAAKLGASPDGTLLVPNSCRTYTLSGKRSQLFADRVVTRHAAERDRRSRIAGSQVVVHVPE